MLKNKKGQNTLEYAIVIAAVIGALLAINLYLKKGVQGRLRESSDQIGKQFDASGCFTQSWKTASNGCSTTTETRTAGATTSAVTQAETITRSENESWGTTPATIRY